MPVTIPIPDPNMTGNPGLRELVDWILGQIPKIPATAKCAYSHTCKALLDPADVDAHTKWHTDMANEIKRVSPLVNVSLL